MNDNIKKTIDFDTILHRVRETKPLIHNITNYVTVNDCANILLACGASPIMADDIDEVEEITALCGGLNINIGTLNHNSVQSMLAAGKKANELGRMIVLDPVGAGASKLRTETALRLIDEIKFDVIRGNISEIKTLASGAGAGHTKGVDADISDKVTEENLKEAVAFAEQFSRKTGAVIAVTGAFRAILFFTASVRESTFNNSEEHLLPTHKVLPSVEQARTSGETIFSDAAHISDIPQNNKQKFIIQTLIILPFFHLKNEYTLLYFLFRHFLLALFFYHNNHNKLFLAQSNYSLVDNH